MKAYENTFERLFKEAGYLVLIYLVLIGSFFVFGFSVRAEAKSTRIKDIVDIEGVRDNLLIGYGLVVGLNGTGDSLRNSPFTQQSLTAMLERLGVNIRGAKIKTNNVAAVMVTATLPAFSNQGARIDVNVSAMGDAGSLQGGTLLVTPLKGADGEVYAVGQGTIITGGYAAQGDAGSVTRNIPTTGRVSEGAIIEREVDYDFAKQTSIRLALRNPDFTTARRISRAINGFIGTDLSHAENSASVKIIRPANYNGTIVDLITDIEQLPIQPDQLARIVIDENSGVIVIGSNVRINNVAIAQGSLTIKVTETPQVSQPSPFSESGETVVVPRTDIDVNRGEDVRLTELDTGVSLQDLVTGLNKLGVGPRDIITILQAIKAAGALQAEIQTM
tara:strand:- start:63611 stop:64777 length:1167 start_codon:yes stop_codon:yes gene_type:complete